MKIQSFPMISGTQVVMVRDEIATGFVVDNDFNFIDNDEQEVFTIFEDINLAVDEANRIVKQHDYIECLIYDKDNKLIKHIAPW